MVKIRKLSQSEKVDFENARCTIIIGSHQSFLSDKDIHYILKELKKYKSRGKICTFQTLDKKLLYEECDKVVGECKHCEHYA